MPVGLLLATSGLQAFRITDPDGTEHLLDANLTGIGVTALKGRWNAPRRIVADAAPLRDGTILRRVAIDAGQVMLALTVFGDTALEIFERLEAMSRWLNSPEGSPLLLGMKRPDDTWREIEAYYQGGLEGDDSYPSALIASGGYATRAVEFYAPEPWWQDGTDLGDTFVLGDVPAVTWPLSWPIFLSSSDVFASTTVSNDGDVEAWPVWTITGPFTELTLRNTTTGAYFKYTASLAAGAQLVVDTRPGRKLVYDPAGANLWRNVLDGSDLWSLARGTNAISVEMTGATSASSVDLVYRNRYWSP